ncbi:MAG TPA: ATP-binding cassette domain-containing protein [Longimicrobiaceae bacterium]|nr:ATP-binding cassette domain-containing protein [Longimicrobiaceae bacterium]
MTGSAVVGETGGALPLDVRALGKAYRRKAVLVDVDLALRPGEAVALLGSNGAGKSTLIGCITGDRRPDSGSVHLCGADPFSDLAGAAGCMGYVPEHPFLYGELTVGEMLQFVAAARGLPTDAAEAEAERLLELLGLAGARETLCRELSQGMGRKTAIAAALLHAPRVLLLDEALNGVDRGSAARIVEELDRRRAAGAAVLIASHDLNFVAEWCDRGLMLAPGGRWTALHGAAWQAWRTHPTLHLAQPEDTPSSGTPDDNPK